eukprot:1140750-Pelagomonas_calceolata.AAC.5
MSNCSSSSNRLAVHMYGMGSCPESTHYQEAALHTNGPVGRHPTCPALETLEITPVVPLRLQATSSTTPSIKKKAASANPTLRGTQPIYPNTPDRRDPQALSHLNEPPSKRTRSKSQSSSFPRPISPAKQHPIPWPHNTNTITCPSLIPILQSIQPTINLAHLPCPPLLPSLPLANTHKTAATKQRRKTYRIHINRNLSIPIISPLGQTAQHTELWNYKQNRLRRLAKQTTPLDAMNTVYNYDLDITHFSFWRIFTAKKRDWGDAPPLQQKQYLTYFAPMTIEKWALPMFRTAGFTPAKIKPAARAEIECVCCEVCNYSRGKEPLSSEPIYPDMYICDVCH